MVLSQESSYRMFSTSASDYEEESSRVLDNFKAATSLLTALAENQAVNQNLTQSNAVESWSKITISKVKNNAVIEKTELKRLNQQLKTYLENVRRLEALNRALQAEVEKAKIAAAPRLMDKSELSGKLGSIRSKLEEESLATVKLQTRIEANEILISHLNDRLRFFHLEAEIQKQKLITLQTYLTETANQKEFLRRNAKVLEDEIAAEKARILATEKDLEALLLSLQNGRNGNKKLELEMQTLLDEISFAKAIFNEEIVHLRNRVSNGIAFSGGDVSSFYKSELAIAIRQIREDFQALNDHQLYEYRQLKETELQSTIAYLESERMRLSKLNTNQELEFSVKELGARLEENKADVLMLNARNAELFKRQSDLEARIKDTRARIQIELARKSSEIESIRLQNEQIASEIEHWDKYIRSNLETEIQTYRSILNSQIRLLDKVANSFVVTHQVVEEVIKRPVVSSTLVSEKFITTGNTAVSSSSSQIVTSSSKSEKIIDDQLNYAFKKIDANSSGYISIDELQELLAKTGHNFTERDIYRMIQSVDRDGDGRLNFEGSFNSFFNFTQVYL